jgi:hypothetical protein
MRKFLVIIVTLTTLGFLAGEASAARVNLGRHSKAQIQATCNRVGGIFSEGDGGAYWCVKECDGTRFVCDVTCNAREECEGGCPKCGRRELTLPVLGGADAADRTLTNSPGRPKKRY